MVKLLEKYEFLEGLYYSKDHLWAKIEDDKVRVGITDFAQQQAGTILYVRLLPSGREIPTQGKPLGTMESGKWIGSLKSPVAGTIAETNLELQKKAGLLNEDPYGRGWLALIKPSNLEADLKNLMTDFGEIEEWLKAELKRMKK
jgi:glycine cleavage system H protein